MNGYQMRQGTIYRKIADGSRMVLIHHNPMALESLILQGDARGFDAAHPAVITVDTLIALRRSGEYEEEGDLPSNEVRELIGEMLAQGGVTEEVAKLLKAVLEE